MQGLPPFATTVIGSFPHQTCASLCERLAELDVPVWPQLARRSFRENMYVQYSTPLPALVIDDEAEKTEYLETLGLKETGLARVIRAGYELLHLITFFTVGPKEARAWTVAKGSKAPQAAGAIHTDFEKGFIRAETIAYDDFVSLGGEQAAKDAGKMRQEGKTYTVLDGDIMLFKFNV